MVNVYSHALMAPPPSALGPGTWLYGGSRALMKRVLASNPRVNVFHRGFAACDSYAGGEAAMAKVRCPVLFVLGQADAMTPPKAAQSLQRAARNAKTVLVDAGHQMMTEAPDAVLFALRDFLAA
jgi:pimeloyl-ACP methyl ester carboxylesterase